MFEKKKIVSAVELLLLSTLCLLCSSCAPLKRYAMNQLGNILADSRNTFMSDNDPTFVREALPFSLKLIEGTLAETPRHRGLLLTATSGFVQYAYAFISADADYLEDDDYDASEILRERAKKFYLRARAYGLRGLELRHPGITKMLQLEPEKAVSKVGKKDVDFLYWTGAAWGSAISMAKDDFDLIADKRVVAALFDRALELKPAFDNGAIRNAMISYEMSRSGGKGKPGDRARVHYKRAVELCQGKLASPYVAYAEDVCIQEQKRAEFEKTLKLALAIDPDKKTEWRMMNLIMQKRARWLLARIDDLFIE